MWKMCDNQGGLEGPGRGASSPWSSARCGRNPPHGCFSANVSRCQQRFLLTDRPDETGQFPCQRNHRLLRALARMKQVIVIQSLVQPFLRLPSNATHAIGHASIAAPQLLAHHRQVTIMPRDLDQDSSQMDFSRRRRCSPDTFFSTGYRICPKSVFWISSWAYGPSSLYVLHWIQIGHDLSLSFWL